MCLEVIQTGNTAVKGTALVLLEVLSHACFRAQACVSTGKADGQSGITYSETPRTKAEELLSFQTLTWHSDT